MYAIILKRADNMKVERLDHYGRGIIKKDGKIGFIKNALEQEDIEYELIKEHKNYFEGISKSISNESKDRVKPQCNEYLICGGCNLLHMNDELKVKFKQDKIFNILEKLNTKINELVYSSQYNYRNKVVLHVQNGKIGLYKDKSNELIEVNDCLLLSKKINEIIKVLKDYVKEERKIKTITIKLGNITEEVMIIVEGEIGSYYKLLDLCNVLIINDKVITDQESIISYIGDKRYYVSKNSFFQVNYDISTKIYEKVKSYIKEMGSKNVLDLYCGVGTIGIFIADAVENVLGIEVVEDAVKDANKNMRLNNIDNISFRLGKVEDLIQDIKGIYDTVVVDPPRGGLDKKVIDSLIEINPKNIIYVSCDIMTLRRDLEMLNEEYNIIEVTPYDMFPNTFHCESIAVLEREN